MEAIVINSNTAFDVSRGLKGQIIDYIVVGNKVHAIFLTSYGYFKNLPIDLLGEGHSLNNY